MGEGGEGGRADGADAGRTRPAYRTNSIVCFVGQQHGQEACCVGVERPTDATQRALSQHTTAEANTDVG